jgi:NAD(P)-dependent dehydrogenase (short-subunit alcohol dehydrogenase family)
MTATSGSTTPHDAQRPLALVTGASRGLGLALTRALTARDWDVIGDGRDPERLHEALGTVTGPGRAMPMPGDVADPSHRKQLADAVADLGPLTLLVNNASTIGLSPQPPLLHFPLATLRDVYEVNLFAPVGLLQLLLPALAAARGTVVNVSSDAAVEAYPGWGGYGSAKAALDQVSAVLAAEQTDVRVLSFDPGDMATDLAQEAFPGADMSDRSAPESVVPALLRLVTGPYGSGRYRAVDLADQAVST